MGAHTIPADTFFTRSPEIRIRTTSDRDHLVKSFLNEHTQLLKNALPVDCFLRSASDEERDGHLARLKGVQRMATFLQDMGADATMYYHDRVSNPYWNTYLSASITLTLKIGKRMVYSCGRTSMQHAGLQ